MRYNIFNKAHLPLKTALINGCISIGETRDVNLLFDQKKLCDIDQALNVFREQLAYEENYILPFIFDYEPSVWNNYITDHMAASKRCNELQRLIKLYNEAVTQEDKDGVQEAICSHYNQFVLFNFNHMDDEEAVLNEILWRYYKDEVLMQIDEKIELLPHLIKHSQKVEKYQFGEAA